jgi:S-(hydroxymethyl)glutathione dehydrogenase/alcohol dehydrogenase
VKTRAAVLWEGAKEWQVEDVDLDGPKEGEVLVQMAAAGLCHSDEHLITGDMPGVLPMIGGHEGSGIVQEVGPGVKSLQPGDHVSMSFIPSCGKCRMCSTGRQNLCDTGAMLLAGTMLDGTTRVHAKGQDLHLMAAVGTFAAHQVVSEMSLIKVEPDLPLPQVALVSCGVATGWGSAVQRAQVVPGDIVVVVGVGGIGANAVQGARMAGARMVFAVDPLEFKREQAMQLGATHTAASMAEVEPTLRELSWGTMADKVILTPGVMYGDLLGPAMALTGKGGTCVVTAVAPWMQMDVQLSLFDLAMSNKEIKGTIFGSLNPRADIPRLLNLYRAGDLKLDELITRTYTLDQINDGYQDMRDGLNIRGVITF